MKICRASYTYIRFYDFMKGRDQSQYLNSFQLVVDLKED